jgi:UDP-N-acetylmuramoyl-tripeptide--D-alanyl-D-alanine ligase
MTAFVSSEKLAPLVKKVQGLNKIIFFPKVVSNIYDVEEGTLFIPRKEERYDGHQFIEAAIEGGAAGALWRAGEPIPETIPEDFPLFITEDPAAVCRYLAAEYLKEHRAEVVFVEGDYTASFILRALKTWTSGKNTEVIKEQETKAVDTAELILSLDLDTELVFVEAVESSSRMHEMATLLQPDIALVSYYNADAFERAEVEEGSSNTLHASLLPNYPETQHLAIPSWLESYRPLLEAAASAYKIITGQEHPPMELLTAEAFGFQTMKTRAEGLVLFEAEAMEKTNLDYTLGWLSHIQPFERRILVIDEGFQSDRFHKSVHELFADHITNSITDVFAVGEKAFWVSDALSRAGRRNLNTQYYKTHVDAIDDLRGALNGPNVIMYKGANRELIYQILHQLNRN